MRGAGTRSDRRECACPDPPLRVSGATSWQAPSPSPCGPHCGCIRCANSISDRPQNSSHGSKVSPACIAEKALKTGPKPTRQNVNEKGMGELLGELVRRLSRACINVITQALEEYGTQGRTRTGTLSPAGDFKIISFLMISMGWYSKNSTKAEKSSPWYNNYFAQTRSGVLIPLPSIWRIPCSSQPVTLLRESTSLCRKGEPNSLTFQRLC